MIGPYDFKRVEEGVLSFWQAQQTHKRLNERNAGRKKFFFLQGPPYTSGKLHMGHAWNNSLKDMMMRYKRMCGYDVFDRAAYDMHGLPTEHKVQALHNLKFKEDIVQFGIERFIKECITFSSDRAKEMNEDLKRLGVWMDFDNACLPINNSYIEGVWYLLKKVHENKRLYEGLRTMTWCASCATAMAKHECEYKQVTDTSIFVKFPIVGKENEYLVIWTTTPWTLAFNLAVMVHPELEYVRAQVDDEVWVLAKGLASPVVQTVAGKELKIIEEFKGEELEGVQYTHPWHDKIMQFTEIKAQHPKAHTVVLSDEFVNLSAGSGLVHCAPGCGPEDYEVGRRNNIPPFNAIKENGAFPEDMGEFAGWKAKVDDKRFIETLGDALIAATPVEHDYAHCERCRNPVVFRTTKQWFFKIEDIKERMVEGNEQIQWRPESGKRAFKSWLENLRDNSITKQRFWGTPAPIWKCGSCDAYEVIGSSQELKERAGHCPDNLHKPWIDHVEISCDCGSMKKRIPDVLDVWIDAGTLSWNILDYPQNKELKESLWPADFICEAKEQVRGWFNLLMVTSILAFDDPVPFKSCFMHGMLTDVDGVKMSKSLGNVLSPYEIIDKHGADTLRYYIGGTAPGEDISFSWDEAKLRFRNLSVLWNVHKYLIDFVQQQHITIKPLSELELEDEERYMLSLVHSTIKKVTKAFDSIALDQVNELCQELFLELSRTYMQFTRDKAMEKPELVASVIFESITTVLRLLAPLAPFISEATYQNLKRSGFPLSQESVHMESWPESNASYIDAACEQRFDAAKDIIQGMLSARDQAKLGIRWPVQEVLITSKDAAVRDAIANLSEIIMTHTNVKKLTLVDAFNEVSYMVKADAGRIGKTFGSETARILEIISQIPEEQLIKAVVDDKSVVLTFPDVKHELSQEHFSITTTVHEPYVSGEMKKGMAYLDTTRTPALDSEGFLREVTRRVQSMRKSAGLTRTDQIHLAVQAPADVSTDQWADTLKEKVGASSVTLQVEDKEYKEKKVEKIKGKEFVIAWSN